MKEIELSVIAETSLPKNDANPSELDPVGFLCGRCKSAMSNVLLTAMTIPLPLLYRIAV